MILVTLQKLKHNTNQNYDPDYYVWIKFFKMLQEIDASLNAFGKIMNWATKLKSNGYKFTNSYPLRKSLMRELNDMLCENEVKPFQKEISLSDDTSELITSFDFESMCISLLADETIMKDKIYTFIDDDPRIFKRKKQ